MPSPSRTQPLHLPELVRRLLLETLGRRRATDRRHDPLMALQDSMNRRRRRRMLPPVFQNARDLACAPRRMRIAHRKHLCLHRRARLQRAHMRAARAISQLPITCLPPRQPFIAHIGTDPEPPAQLPAVRTLRQRQPHKFLPLSHNRHLFPRHGQPPREADPCQYERVSHLPEHLSVMCPGYTTSTGIRMRRDCSPPKSFLRRRAS